MGKYKYRAKLDSIDDKIDANGICIYKDKKIIYQENNIKVTMKLFDNNIELSRVCNEYDILLILEKNKKTKSQYKIFGGSKIFELETYTKELIINDKKIEIKYILEENEFSYILELEDLWF